MKIRFESVKDQLLILGHTVPDDIIRGYLDELNAQSALDTAASAPETSLHADKEQSDSHNVFQFPKSPTHAGDEIQPMRMCEAAAAETSVADSNTHHIPGAPAEIFAYDSSPLKLGSPYKFHPHSPNHTNDLPDAYAQNFSSVGNLRPRPPLSQTARQSPSTREREAQKDTHHAGPVEFESDADKKGYESDARDVHGYRGYARVGSTPPRDEHTLSPKAEFFRHSTIQTGNNPIDSPLLQNQLPRQQAGLSEVPEEQVFRFLDDYFTDVQCTDTSTTTHSPSTVSHLHQSLSTTQPPAKSHSTRVLPHSHATHTTTPHSKCTRRQIDFNEEHEHSTRHPDPSPPPSESDIESEAQALLADLRATKLSLRRSRIQHGQSRIGEVPPVGSNLHTPESRDTGGNSRQENRAGRHERQGVHSTVGSSSWQGSGDRTLRGEYTRREGGRSGGKCRAEGDEGDGGGSDNEGEEPEYYDRWAGRHGESPGEVERGVRQWKGMKTAPPRMTADEQQNRSVDLTTPIRCKAPSARAVTASKVLDRPTRSSARPSTGGSIRSDRTLEPVNVNGSFLSRSATKAAGTTHRKVDRVARYSSLQKQWSSNAFLKNCSTRPAQGFVQQFAVAHAEAKAKQRNARVSTTQGGSSHSKSLNPNKYIAPTDKRRDNLRWQTRMRLILQE